MSASGDAAVEELYKQLKSAGGDAEMMHLPKLGIQGNSHMRMQDRNNLELADLIVKWIEEHVAARRASGARPK